MTEIIPFTDTPHHLHVAGSPDGVFERRRAPRFRFDLVMPAVLGRGDALIHDISAEGARVSHFSPQPLDMAVRLMFFYRGRHFYATGRVLSSRVKELGTGPFGATTYESRLRFIDCSLEAIESLEKIAAQIDRERRQQQQLPCGSRPQPMRLAQISDNSGYYVTCRLQGRRWIKSWSRNPEQPADGFTVPAALGEGEVQMLCNAFEKMDERGRDLVHGAAQRAVAAPRRRRMAAGATG